MKKHGFTVNSFEEYEFNRVFAGRNWNAGEVVELVLRRPSGAFYPTPYLLNTLCHELAHIKHMNHGAQFHALWRALRGEVEALRRRGYYGDGMWSAGVRVGDGERVGGAGEMLGAEEVPEWTCGGAQEKKRPARTARRRRVARNRRQGGATETGRQTERRRKPGGRVRAEVFGEGGARLDGRTLDEKEGSTKGKRA
ncbi:WLM-domain-containing protein, partial [Calocera cornea HHB12733]